MHDIRYRHGRFPSPDRSDQPASIAWQGFTGVFLEGSQEEHVMKHVLKRSGRIPAGFGFVLCFSGISGTFS
jgi:hypothetical protein